MKKIICTILILLTMLQIMPVYASYSPQFVDEAQALYDIGLFKGTDNGFDLDKRCDRVQAGVLFVRMLGKESEALSNPKKHPFTDVPEWASPYIGQMYYDGYTKGISQIEYGVGDITPNQFSTFCLRALGYSENESDKKHFKYESALNKMLDENIIDQKEYDTIKSSDIFYRDFAVKLVYNSHWKADKNKEESTPKKKPASSGGGGGGGFNNNNNNNSSSNDSEVKDDSIELNSAEDIYALSRILATNYAKEKYYTKNASLSLKKDMDCFEIPAELTTDADKIKYFQTASYKLTNDVNVVLTNEYSSSLWNPNAFLGIGNHEYPFKGSFNGNNKTITLSANKTLGVPSTIRRNVGFFSQTDSARIFNTNIAVSSNIKEVETIAGVRLAMGALIGFASKTNVSNCSVDFTNAEFGFITSKEEIDEYVAVGGMVGSSEFSIYDNCRVNLKNSKIYATANNVNGKGRFGGVSVGGILGQSSAGSDNKTNLGRLGNQLYNCLVVSNNDTQQDIIVASIIDGTECAVGGVVGITYNNCIVKNCAVDVTKGNIKAIQSGSPGTSNLGTAVGGIIGRMEHTSEINSCRVVGDYLNISTDGPDNRHIVGGIAGNAYGPIHRDVTPIFNCHFEGSGTSTICAKVDTTNLKDSTDHFVGVGGIAGLAGYLIHDSTVRNVLIINDSYGMKRVSYAGEIVGLWQGRVNPNGNFIPRPVGVERCTSFGVTFDISSNVKKTNL